MKIEVCVGSAAEALAAQECGADRVELCAALGEGGLTPSYGEMLLARELLSKTALHVIIRPRRGDFLYSDMERRCMVADIESARRIGVDGVVIGGLTAAGDIDRELVKVLMDAAGGMSVTFHRAFDMCRCRERALEELIGLGCNRVLTSGGRRTAEEGIGELRGLVSIAGERITVMPGCGINAGNIERIARGTDAREFHFSANMPIRSGMLYRNEAVSMGGDGMADEYALTATDREKIREIRGIVDGLV